MINVVVARLLGRKGGAGGTFLGRRWLLLEFGVRVFATIVDDDWTLRSSAGPFPAARGLSGFGLFNLLSAGGLFSGSVGGLGVVAVDRSSGVGNGLEGYAGFLGGAFRGLPVEKGAQRGATLVFF